MANVIGFVKLHEEKEEERKRKVIVRSAVRIRSYERPLKVSVGEALMRAIAKRYYKM